MPTHTAVSHTVVSPSDADPHDFEIARDGDRNLAFKGWPIGYADTKEDAFRSSNTLRGVTVSVFATTNGNLVLQACRWSEKTVDNEMNRDETCSVGIFTPGDYYGDHPGGVAGALDWLREDAGGKLGPTSKAAWVQACHNWDKLEGEAVETV